MYKRKHPERFDAWWRPLTRQGDPSHRYDLIGEAFDAGFEAGKEAALVTLGKKLLEQYATPLDTEGRPRMETAVAPADPDEETPCPKRDDGVHCECWYEGEACCSCGSAAMLNGQAHPPCRPDVTCLATTVRGRTLSQCEKYPDCPCGGPPASETATSNRGESL